MSTVLRFCSVVAARAVGDRDERRVQPRELGQRAAEVALALVGLAAGRTRRRSEGRPRGEALVDPHRAQV